MRADGLWHEVMMERTSHGGDSHKLYIWNGMHLRNVAPVLFDLSAQETWNERNDSPRMKTMRAQGTDAKVNG